ncbi:GatB/YqeY domain-containing protein [Pseudohongiella sp.]|uniref:GatB/YqeY domain-containing protein n=1 Tax=marine sediment metagenome TaxID=412755 RepID=A0A0F9Y4L1_9ZZZZ|nr:GatB/YqeY domain-containing protein [Pseudohongiella sp.]HDZ10003.1 GatB/YqeY domain-containing protein [Pseudohongiella sp.]HEA63899.1 GatB/YqeY domain-containing protein [Pseudohongiella sp.]
MADSALKLQLTEAMKDAMRAKDKARLGTVRLALSEVKRIEVDERIEPDDARVLNILEKMIKQRRESIRQYESASRKDLADIEQAEIDVLQTFMPQPLSDAEIDTIVTQALTDTGASSVQDMGKVMAAVKPQMAGRADMGAVGQLIKKKLGQA